MYDANRASVRNSLEVCVTLRSTAGRDVACSDDGFPQRATCQGDYLDVDICINASKDALGKLLIRVNPKSRCLTQECRPSMCLNRHMVRRTTYA